MALFSFAIGLTLRRGEQLLEFRRHLSSGDVQFEDPLTGKIYTWALTKVFREINSAELVIFRGDASGATKSNGDGTKPLPLISSLESIPAKYTKELARRLDYINGCKKQGITKGRRNALTHAIENIAKRRNETSPSTSTVMTWWRKLDHSDCYPGSLVSGYYQRPRSRALRRSTQDLIRKILRQEYFTKARYPLTRSHRLINQAVKNDPQESKKEISLSSVRRIANEVTPYYRDVARYGPAYAKNKWRYSLEGITTTRVLERVEVDHTILDIVVICDRSGLPMGRPTITIIIDAHSGYVISFFISFWGTGLGPTLSALKIAVCPKHSYCEKNLGITNQWMGYGLFELIVVDNGLEFHSPQFQLVGWLLNADIQYCAVRQPWLKPSVERALGVMTGYLPSEGRVHKPLSNYLPPDPRKTASIAYSQLCLALLKYFVDVLPFEPSRRTLIEPYEVFRDGFERIPPPLLPSSFHEMELIGAMSKRLTVGNEGVVFQYLRYNCVELQNLRRQISHTFTTSIKFKPEDLNFIYVQDPITQKWLLVPSCQPEYTFGLSIVQHNAIRGFLKEQLTKRNTLETLMRGKLGITDLYDGFLVGNRGKKNTNAAKKFGALTSAQILDGESHSRKIAPPESALVTPEDFVANRDIPTFATFQLD